ncbi:MAG: aldo/keto reductase [Chloroflexota bacterium]|nr:aldo/keto reductase [Chloroflexota bacterium]
MLYVSLELPKRVSKIGLGTWQFGAREWGYGKSYAEREAAEIVRRALDLGITLFDTAEIYGLGRSERILGKAIGDDRDRAFVATKIFPVLPVAPVVVRRGIRSARRVGVSQIDLYQVHWPNRVVSDGTTMQGMRKLRERGLVGEVGVSNYPLDRWRTASNRPTNLLRRRAKLFRPESFARAEPLFQILREIAAGHDATPSQVALAWTIRHTNVVAIPGASSVEQVESNAAAAELTLTAGEVSALGLRGTGNRGVACCGVTRSA